MKDTDKIEQCGWSDVAPSVAALTVAGGASCAAGMVNFSPAVAAAAGLFCFGASLYALPKASGWVLARKRDAILKWWDENLELYKEFKKENPDREPSKKGETQDERDLAIWWLDAMRLVRSGELMREKVQALIDCGSRMPDGVDPEQYETVEEYRARYVAPVSKLATCLISLTVGLGIAGLIAVTGFAGNIMYPIAFLVGGIAAILFAAVGAICDQRSSVLPFGLSIATYPCAALTAFGYAGGTWLAICALTALAIWAVFALSNQFFRMMGGADAVGAGDRRLAPAAGLACGPVGTICGMGAMCICMIACYIPRFLSRNLTMKSRVPMGPFLLVWLCIGMPLGCII